MERRLSAILAADVVGYSRLMGANEVGTLQSLQALHGELVNPEISKHGGRIVKLTGDGILAEFSSVVGAVECALEVQRARAQFRPSRG
jgi:adenylate cyclase